MKGELIMFRKRLSVLSLAVFTSIMLAALGRLNATTYYVSPDGKDENDGSKDSPFNDPNKAIKELKPGDTLLFLPGVYGPRIFVEGVSGTKDEDVSFPRFTL